MSDPKQEPVICPKCGRVWGLIVTLQGVKLLKKDHDVCTFFRGVCSQCGNTLYWSTSEHTLGLLLQQAKNRV